MSLETSLQKIKNFLVERYGDNLAAILIFGSANTGGFIERESDIDNIIFLKQQKNLNIQKEIKFLINELKSENFATQYFHTLEGIKEYLKERSSWSKYITIVAKRGSRILYSTPEFEETKEWLRKHPPTKKGIKGYLKRKDKVELKGYFKKTKGYWLTKALLSHLRRKLQLINYYENKSLEFDFKRCLDNINLDKIEKNKLDVLYHKYKTRDVLPDKEVNNYYKIAEEFTNRILKQTK